MARLDGIDHFVVLMLENRSFDSMLGMLYPGRPDFNGLTGKETNPLTAADGSVQQIAVWTDPDMVPGTMVVPSPDPGEQFDDITTQIFGLGADPAKPLPAPTMSGFVDNYMRQPPGDQPFDPRAPMHYYTPDQVPVLSGLARAFAVCDQWHASAPCQTWPNRLFAHTGSAGGDANNTPDHAPYRLPTIFGRLDHAHLTSRIYYHDIPQSLSLGELWTDADARFFPFKQFLADAQSGSLPNYAFIEPRYFTDGDLPNDQHPPHDIALGEQLIAAVYNALRASPAWPRTLLIVTYDEHGGCYDHAPPPAAPPPGPLATARAAVGQFTFDRYGVRVPAVLASPWIAPGTILRSAADGLPADGPPYPFDHTTIIATLRARFDLGPPLTGRDAAAPSVEAALTLDGPTNLGPERLEPSPLERRDVAVAEAKGAPLNDLQKSLHGLAGLLPGAGDDIEQVIATLAKEVPALLPAAVSVAAAATRVIGAVRRLLDIG